MKKDNTEKVLTDIKKLVILALIKQGVQSKEIASILGVDPAIISRLTPSRKMKRNDLEK